MTNRRKFVELLTLLPFSVPFLEMKAYTQAANPAVAQSSGRALDPADGSPVGGQLPDQKWKVHDRSRPQARQVVPGLPFAEERPPSDAIVLFDGKDLSRWMTRGRDGKLSEPDWKVENGCMELVPKAGSLVTKEAFGDCQLHLDWMTPTGMDASRHGQNRGNSGVILMGKYEIQVLSSYDNPTYADGAAGAIYGLYPPMVNPCRPEGEWNSYDVVFKAPRFEGDQLRKAASITLLFNGVMVHDHVELLGSTVVLPLAKYQPHAPELPLMLQGHDGPVRYKNIWIRRLMGYDA